jgi:hypothetical protein
MFVAGALVQTKVLALIASCLSGLLSMKFEGGMAF